MEVKRSFMNLIMRTYEKQHAMNSAKAEKTGSENDNVTISSRANKRLFQDVMENSLEKGLSEVLIDEN